MLVSKARRTLIARWPLAGRWASFFSEPGSVVPRQMLGSAHTPVDTKQLSEQRTNEAPSHKPVLGAVPCQQVDAPYPSDKELSLVHCPAPHSNLLQPCSIYLYRNFKAKGQSLNIQGVSPSAGKGTHKQTRARTHTHRQRHPRTHAHAQHTHTHRRSHERCCDSMPRLFKHMGFRSAECPEIAWVFEHVDRK